MGRKPRQDDLIEDVVMDEATEIVEAPIEIKEEKLDIAALSEKAVTLEAEANMLRAKIVKMMPSGDLYMQNPRGIIRPIPAKLVNVCRRMGFLAVDENGVVLPNDKQPRLVSEFEEAQTQAKASKGGAPVIRDLG